MFRFTIRELLLLTLVVSIGVGWARRERQLRLEFHQLTHDCAIQERLWRSKIKELSLIADLTSAKAHASEKDMAALLEAIHAHGWTTNRKDASRGMTSPPNQ